MSFKALATLDAYQLGVNQLSVTHCASVSDWAAHAAALPNVHTTARPTMLTFTPTARGAMFDLVLSQQKCAGKLPPHVCNP